MKNNSKIIESAIELIAQLPMPISHDVVENSEGNLVKLNSFQDLSLNLQPFGGAAGPVNELSSTDTLYFNLRWYLISNYQQLLSELYVEHGIIQTLVDQPVDDAFRSGFELKTAELDANDIEILMRYVERYGCIRAVKQAKKWGRLFGGGGILIITDQDPKTPFNVKSIGEDTPLEFRPVDMWELFNPQSNIEGDLEVGGKIGGGYNEFYNYYGRLIHHTRVMKVIGKEPPSFIRPRLRGWGMSEVEKVVRSLNQYMKNQDVVFQLLDEAKIDVYRLDGFNTALLNSGGTESVRKRVQNSNLIKNYLHALVMDKDDEYEQKQINFSGLGEILLQIRQGIAADLKMPMTKLFGISSAGFSSGEDDIENYNSMIESEIRADAKWFTLEVLEICCQKLFGFVPKDMGLEFNPLRILNAEEEEKVKDSQFNRARSVYMDGLATAQEAKQAMNKDSLVGIELNENSEGLDPVGQISDSSETKA